MPSGAAEAPSASPALAWQLVSPDLTYSVKHDAVEGLVTTLRTLQGDDVADPAMATEYGLDAPPYRATLAIQPSGQEARQIAVLLGHEASGKNGSRYARVGDTGPVYIVPQWAWQRLFPTLGTLLDVRLIAVPQEEVTHVTCQQDGASWRLERRPAEASAAPTASSTAASTPTWHLVGAPEAHVDASVVTSLLERVTQLSADDLPIDVPSQTGLDRPTLTLTLTLRDGRTERLMLGQPVGQDSSGYYTSRGDTAEVFIVSAITHKALMDAVAKLNPAGAPAAQAPLKP